MSCPCQKCRHYGKTWEQIATEDDERTLAARRKMKERARTAENQLAGTVGLGDRMQSEGARMAEFIADMDEGVPYEVRMACTQFKSDVEAWTRMRAGRGR